MVLHCGHNFLLPWNNRKEQSVLLVQEKAATFTEIDKDKHNAVEIDI